MKLNRDIRVLTNNVVTSSAPRPVRLSPAVLGDILKTVDMRLFKLLANAVADQRIIVEDIGPIINRVTDSEKRQELVKAVCLRNISRTQGDSD